MLAKITFILAAESKNFLLLSFEFVFLKLRYTNVSKSLIQIIFLKVVAKLWKTTHNVIEKDVW